MQDVKETLPVGSVVAGRYLVEQLLGRGGFGAVYLVRDQRVRNNLFALKEVIDTNKRERERFTFEADLLRRVDHSALPRVYRVFEDDSNNRAYMLMDYIDGPNLEKLRQQQPGKRFSLEQVLRIMGPIIQAVSYLHSQKPPIIHRDIKPSNIIVPTSGDEAVLVDFGIAKEFDPESTTTAVRHASPGYGAPEQYATGTNTRTDIYGLGATMYTLLTGIVPADSFYRMTNMGSRGIDPLEPIVNYAADIPEPVANAIYRAMALDNNKRFPTIEEFWRALTNHAPAGAALAAAPIVAAGPPLPRPTVVNTPLPAVHEISTVTTPATTRRRMMLLWPLLLLLLLITAIVGALVLPGILTHRAQSASTPTPGATHTHQPTATATHAPTATSIPSPTSTAPPANVPQLEKNYNGSLHNSAGINASMSLTAIRQNGGRIAGQFSVSQPLLGNGTFNGTVFSNKSLNFTVHSSQVAAPLFFQGNINSDGSLSGTYCSLDSAGNCNPAAGGSGTWQVFPAQPGSGS